MKPGSLACLAVGLLTAAPASADSAQNAYFHTLEECASFAQALNGIDRWTYHCAPWRDGRWTVQRYDTAKGPRR